MPTPAAQFDISALFGVVQPSTNRTIHVDDKLYPKMMQVRAFFTHILVIRVPAQIQSLVFAICLDLLDR